MSNEQKQVLAPLETDWNSLTAEQKRKWVGIAQRYPKMKPDEQSRVKERMSDWTKLTPKQRRDARESFREIDKIEPAKRTDLALRWNEYQALPETEKQQLAPTQTPAPDRKTRRATRERPASATPPAAAPASSESTR